MEEEFKIQKKSEILPKISEYSLEALVTTLKTAAGETT